MKKAALIFLGLLLGWGILKGCMADPAGSAKKVNDAADTAAQAGDSGGVFIASLSGGALLLIAIAIVAFILSRRG
jgi:hypothetical protein